MLERVSKPFPKHKQSFQELSDTSNEAQAVKSLKFKSFFCIFFNHMCDRGVRKKAVKLSTAGYFTTHGSLKMHCLDFGFIPGIEDTLSECRCLKMLK